MSADSFDVHRECDRNRHARPTLLLLEVAGIDLGKGRSPLIGRFMKVSKGSSISSHSRRTWLFDTPEPSMGCILSSFCCSTSGVHVKHVTAKWFAARFSGSCPCGVPVTKRAAGREAAVFDTMHLNEGPPTYPFGTFEILSK